MQSFKEYLTERELTPDERVQKEKIVKALKKDKSLSQDAIHAIATSKAKNESLQEARQVLDADAVRKIFKKVGVVKDLKDSGMTFTDTKNSTIAEIRFSKVVDIDVDMLNKAARNTFKVTSFNITLTPSQGGPLEFFLEVAK